MNNSKSGLTPTTADRDEAFAVPDVDGAMQRNAAEPAKNPIAGFMSTIAGSIFAQLQGNKAKRRPARSEYNFQVEQLEPRAMLAADSGLHFTDFNTVEQAAMVSVQLEHDSITSNAAVADIAADSRLDSWVAMIAETGETEQQTLDRFFATAYGSDMQDDVIVQVANTLNRDEAFTDATLEDGLVNVTNAEVADGVFKASPYEYETIRADQVDFTKPWSVSFDLTKSHANRYETLLDIGKDINGAGGYTVYVGRSSSSYNNSSIRVYDASNQLVVQQNTPFQFGSAIHVELFGDDSQQITATITDIDTSQTAEYELATAPVDSTRLDIRITQGSTSLPNEYATLDNLVVRSVTESTESVYKTLTSAQKDALVQVYRTHSGDLTTESALSDLYARPELQSLWFEQGVTSAKEWLNKGNDSIDSVVDSTLWSATTNLQVINADYVQSSQGVGNLQFQDSLVTDQSTIKLSSNIKITNQFKSVTYYLGKNIVSLSKQYDNSFRMSITELKPSGGASQSHTHNFTANQYAEGIFEVLSSNDTLTARYVHSAGIEERTFGLNEVQHASIAPRIDVYDQVQLDDIVLEQKYDGVNLEQWLTTSDGQLFMTMLEQEPEAKAVQIQNQIQVLIAEQNAPTPTQSAQLYPNDIQANFDYQNSVSNYSSYVVVFGGDNHLVRSLPLDMAAQSARIQAQLSVPTTGVDFTVYRDGTAIHTEHVPYAGTSIALYEFNIDRFVGNGESTTGDITYSFDGTSGQIKVYWIKEFTGADTEAQIQAKEQQLITYGALTPEQVRLQRLERQAGPYVTEIERLIQKQSANDVQWTAGSGYGLGGTHPDYSFSDTVYHNGQYSWLYNGVEWKKEVPTELTGGNVRIKARLNIPTTGLNFHIYKNNVRVHTEHIDRNANGLSEYTFDLGEYIVLEGDVSYGFEAVGSTTLMDWVQEYTGENLEPAIQNLEAELMNMESMTEVQVLQVQLERQLLPLVEYQHALLNRLDALNSGGTTTDTQIGLQTELDSVSRMIQNILTAKNLHVTIEDLAQLFEVGNVQLPDVVDPQHAVTYAKQLEWNMSHLLVDSEILERLIDADNCSNPAYTELLQQKQQSLQNMLKDWQSAQNEVQNMLFLALPNWQNTEGTLIATSADKRTARVQLGSEEFFIDVRSWRLATDAEEFAKLYGNRYYSQEQAITLDLNQGKSQIREVSFTVNASEGPITIIGYNATHKVVTLQAEPGEHVTVSHPDGLTNIVVLNPGQTVWLQDFSANHDPHHSPTYTGVADYTTAIDLALLQNISWDNADRSVNVVYNRLSTYYNQSQPGGYDHSQEYAIGVIENQDPSKYTVLTLHSNISAPVAGSIRYMTLQGNYVEEVPLPSHMYEIRGNQLIIYPNAPSILVWRTTQGSVISHYTQQTEALDSILLDESMNATAHFTFVNGQGSGESVEFGEGQVYREHKSWIFTNNMQFEANISHTSSKEGEVIAHVYTGYGANKFLNHVGTTSTVLQPGEQQTLYINTFFDGSHRGDDYANITIVLQNPDGTMSEFTKYSSRHRDADYPSADDPHIILNTSEKRRMESLTRRITDAIARGTHGLFRGLSDAQRANMIADTQAINDSVQNNHPLYIARANINPLTGRIEVMPEVGPNFYAKHTDDYTDEALRIVQEEALVSGIQVNILQVADELQKKQKLKDWASSAQQEGYETYGIRTDTVMAQFYHGVLYALDKAENHIQRLYVSEVAAQFIGLSGADGLSASERFLSRVLGQGSDRHNFNHQIAAQNLQTFMIEAQYEEVFTDTDFVPGTITDAEANKNPSHLIDPTYEQAEQYIYNPNEKVRVRFDVAENQDTFFSHAFVYAIVNGEQTGILGSAEITQARDKLYIEFDANEAVQSLYYSPARGYEVVTLKVAAWFGSNNGSQSEYVTDGFETTAFIEIPSVNNLSTHENLDVQKKENVILNTVANNFYLDSSLAWNYDLASSYHSNDAYYAADLNLSVNDDKQPVFSPAVGTIVKNNLDGFGNPTVVIEHASQINGQTFYWYTEYLHMYYDQATGNVGILQSNGLVQPLAVGTALSAGQQFGNLGSDGTSTAPHMHQRIFMSNNGEKITNGDYRGIAIDQRLLLSDINNGLGFNVRAHSYIGDNPNGDRMSVEWNDTLGAFINTANNLVYNRSGQRTSSAEDSLWLAYEPGKNINELMEVRWDSDYNEWIRWNTAVDAWYYQNGKKLVWKQDENGIFKFIEL